MAVKVAINGFWPHRPPRSSAPSLEQGLLGTDVRRGRRPAISSRADNLAYLLKYDSTQGRFNGTVRAPRSLPPTRPRTMY